MTPAERTDRMIGRIAREHGVTVAMIKGRSRSPRALITARFQAYEMLHRRGWSLPMIGRHLQRDHTTVLHGLRRAPELRALWITQNTPVDNGDLVSMPDSAANELCRSQRATI